MKLNKDLLYQIYAIVEEIPEGKVATYKQIAEMLGCPKNSRLVGKALSLASFYGQFPCHRVVNHQGRLVPGWKEQKNLLEQEGITVSERNMVNLKVYQWH